MRKQLELKDVAESKDYEPNNIQTESLGLQRLQTTPKEFIARRP
jgi:hypothetical protein